MKKVILLLLLATSYCANLQAQIIETDSKTRTVIKEPEKPKGPRFTYFTAKLGAGFHNTTSSTQNDSRGSFNIGLGLIRQINDYGLYAGGQIGAALGEIDGGGYSGIDFAYILRIGPTLGIMKNIANNWDFDGHFGIGYGYCPSLTESYFVPEIGAGVWYKRFFAGLEYQGYIHDDNDYSLLLNLGIRF